MSFADHTPLIQTNACIIQCPCWNHWYQKVKAKSRLIWWSSCTLFTKLECAISIVMQISCFTWTSGAHKIVQNSVARCSIIFDGSQESDDLVMPVNRSVPQEWMRSQMLFRQANITERSFGSRKHLNVTAGLTHYLVLNNASSNAASARAAKPLQCHASKRAAQLR